ncbi:Mannan endo-1,4-beta-mannosidase [Ascochyta rabiei]|uniref:Hydrolase n=1 Tax=Didymella rabiei TaxID=5454 RepID=A0A162VYH9_DIDRA|nr:Mannan endo-1,4-beta-mannosidase [Ascochyta rabiei]KZM18674.1 hydrolase [Ascochyta rabiei]UPX16193.1 Mannan endo-1,4-beta-mannosidase [Ascochyta rabiei]
MKLATILSFAGAVAALPAARNDVSARASYSKVDGLKFNIDGVTKYYAGTNSYWIPFLTNDNDVNVIMGHLATSKQNILRVNDVTSIPSSGTVYFQSFSGSTATINTGANGLQRLDAVVKAAEKNGIKLIINFVNNWTDYGGMAAYFSACGVSSNAQWYQSTKCQAMYQAYVEAVVSRYRTSTAVFASSNYVRSLDSDHMIAIGDEGFGLTGDGSYPYQFGEGLDFAANLALPNVSFGTFHLYPESWGTTNDWGSAWITAHGAACEKANKPCLLEEYGVEVAADHCPVESEWQATSLGLKDAGMAADLFWQLGDTIPSTGALTSNDGNTIYYNSSDWTCLVTDHIKKIG